MTRRAVLGVAIAAVVVVGIICAVALLGPSRKDVVRIGGLFALTGDGADWGISERQAVLLAVEQENAVGGVDGKKIELITEDAPAEKVNESVTAFRRLVDVSRVPVIIGPTWDDVAAAVAPLADQTQTVVVAPDASSGIEAKKDYGYFLSVFAPEASEMNALAKYLTGKGIKKAATVYNQDPFSTQWESSFVSAAKGAGIEVLERLAVSDPDTKDFRSQIQRLKGCGAGAVYLEFTSQDTKGPFMRQARELDLGVLFVSSSTSETESLAKSYAQYVEGLVYAAPKRTQALDEFTAAYEKRWGEKPKAPAAPYAYDAAKMVINVIRAGATTPPQIRDALLSTSGCDGVSAANMSFNRQGRIVWPAEQYVPKTIKDGKFVETAAGE